MPHYKKDFLRSHSLRSDIMKIKSEFALKIPKLPALFRISLSLSYQKIIMLIWTFYSSASALFWLSNLKRSYSVDSIMKLCDYMTAALLVGALLLKQRYRIKRILLYAFFLMITVVVELVAINRDFAVLSMFMICFVSMDYQKFIRYDIKLKLFWFVMILLMWKAGIVQNFADYFNGTFKQSLGFQHPNTFAMFSLIILLEWLYLRYEKAKLPELLLIPVFWYVIMKISPSRTTGYTFLFVYLLFLVAKYFPKIFSWKPVIWIMMAVGPIIGVFSVIITKMYIQHDKLAYEINELMTNRIDFQAQYWQAYPVKLFGGKIDTESSVDVILDSGYIRCILTYGIVLSVVLCLLFSMLIYYALKNHQIGIALMAVFFLMMGFAETAMLRLVMNITFLAVFNQQCTKKRWIMPKFQL